MPPVRECPRGEARHVAADLPVRPLIADGEILVGHQPGGLGMRLPARPRPPALPDLVAELVQGLVGVVSRAPWDAGRGSR